MRLAAEEVEVGQKVVRTSATLETGDELEEDAVDAVAEACLVPLALARMLLALVQHQRLQVVSVDRQARQVEVAVAERLQDRETLLAAAALKRRKIR